MGVSLRLVGALTLILGIQLINIHVVVGITEDRNSLTQPKEYEPPNQGGPNSTQGSGTR